MPVSIPVYNRFDLVLTVRDTDKQLISVNHIKTDDYHDLLNQLRYLFKVTMADLGSLERYNSHGEQLDLPF
jgi:chromosome condensin MukBEF ATPase and DNA-binding subunit MukB